MVRVCRLSGARDKFVRNQSVNSIPSQGNLWRLLPLGADLQGLHGQFNAPLCRNLVANISSTNNKLERNCLFVVSL
jgi:hypothetical protein